MIPDPQQHDSRRYSDRRRYDTECAVCGLRCIKRNDTTTCSLICREVLRKRRRVDAAATGACPMCGIGDVKLPYSAGEYKVCSALCRRTAHGRQTNGTPIDAPKRERTTSKRYGTVMCGQCGSEFTKAHSRHKFCSDRCSMRYGSQTTERKARTKELYREKIALRDIEIGSCSLCGVSHTEIKRAEELGGVGPEAASTYHSDHIRPKSHGGVDDSENRRWLCWYCNKSRASISSEFDGAVAAGGRAFWAEILSRFMAAPDAVV